MMRKLVLALLILFLVVFSISVVGFQSRRDFDREEIKRINLQIRLQGLEWVAGETSLTYLSPEEKKQRLGAIIPLYEDPEKFVYIQEKVELPNSIDWRSIGGKNYMTTIKNQGSCGSCWAFASCGVVETIYNIEKGLYSTQPVYADIKTNQFDSYLKTIDDFDNSNILSLRYPDLSEQDLISCSYAGSCDGGSTWKALRYIERNGVVSESCFPYKADDIPCFLCSDWGKKLWKIRGWGYITQSTVNKNAIKTALQDGALSFYMEIYSDFYNYRSGVYEKTATANYEEDHVVVLIGYSEKDNYWICKNSWGTNWGENGYFRIRMGECKGGLWVMKAWGVSLILNNKPPVMATIADQTVKEGQALSFQITAKDPDNDPLTFSATSLPSGATFTSSNRQFDWTPSYTQSGEYHVTFFVTDDIFERSQTVKITVINVKKGKGKY